LCRDSFGELETEILWNKLSGELQEDALSQNPETKMGSAEGNVPLGQEHEQAYNKFPRIENTGDGMVAPACEMN
jgi:hypothetical protein